MVPRNIIMLNKHFFYLPWNKIPIFMFQRMLFLGINLVNLKQIHPKYWWILHYHKYKMEYIGLGVMKIVLTIVIIEKNN